MTERRAHDQTPRDDGTAARPGGEGRAPRLVDGPPSAAGAAPSPGGRLAPRLHVERECDLDREAMLAALRVALGLPRVLRRKREAA